MTKKGGPDVAVAWHGQAPQPDVGPQDQRRPEDTVCHRGGKGHLVQGQPDGQERPAPDDPQKEQFGPCPGGECALCGHGATLGASEREGDPFFAAFGTNPW